MLIVIKTSQTIKDTWTKTRGRAEAGEGEGFGWGGEKMKTTGIEQQLKIIIIKKISQTKLGSTQGKICRALVFKTCFKVMVE